MPYLYTWDMSSAAWLGLEKKLLSAHVIIDHKSFEGHCTFISFTSKSGFSSCCGYLFCSCFRRLHSLPSASSERSDLCAKIRQICQSVFDGQSRVMASASTKLETYGDPCLQCLVKSEIDGSSHYWENFLWCYLGHWTGSIAFRS